jgi:hypothetical protein
MVVKQSSLIVRNENKIISNWKLIYAKLWSNIVDARTITREHTCEILIPIISVLSKSLSNFLFGEQYLLTQKTSLIYLRVQIPRSSNNDIEFHSQRVLFPIDHSTTTVSTLARRLVQVSHSTKSINTCHRPLPSALIHKNVFPKLSCWQLVTYAGKIFPLTGFDIEFMNRSHFKTTP